MFTDFDHALEQFKAGKESEILDKVDRLACLNGLRPDDPELDAEFYDEVERELAQALDAVFESSTRTRMAELCLVAALGVTGSYPHDAEAVKDLLHAAIVHGDGEAVLFILDHEFFFDAEINGAFKAALEDRFFLPIGYQRHVVELAELACDPGLPRRLFEARGLILEARGLVHTNALDSVIDMLQSRIDHLESLACDLPRDVIKSIDGNVFEFDGFTLELEESGVPELLHVGDRVGLAFLRDGEPPIGICYLGRDPEYFGQFVRGLA